MYQGCDLVTSTRNIFKMWVASDRWIQKWVDFKQKNRMELQEAEGPDSKEHRFGN